MLVSEKPGGPNAKPGRPNGACNAQRECAMRVCNASAQELGLPWACTFHIICLNFI